MISKVAKRVCMIFKERQCCFCASRRKHCK